MNIQEYISSGIIESYALGLASAEERAEFERMCAAHAEVKAALDKFERALEKQTFDHAVNPPASLKGRIFAEIEIENDRMPAGIVSAKSAPVVRTDWLRPIAAAAILLLVGSTILNFYFFSQYQKYIAKYDELIASQNQVTIVNQTLQKKLQEYSTAMNLLRDPAMAVIKLPVVPKSPSPGSLATVYWDTRSKDVYLLVNSLPKPLADKQYQLWAIVDGKPVDAGVFDINEGEGPALIKMKNIPQAQAFAITLEKRGGSIAPTMDAMYVMGNVAG